MTVQYKDERVGGGHMYCTSDGEHVVLRLASGRSFYLEPQEAASLAVEMQHWVKHTEEIAQRRRDAEYAAAR